MKRIFLASIVFILLLALVACGNTSASDAAATASTSLGQEEELLLGTFKLEDTDLAVSADQAAELLLLWETLKSLLTSGTAATAEIDAVVSQIESTMSQEQINAISAMDLTQQDLASALADNGISAVSSSSSDTSGVSSTQGMASGSSPDGNMTGGNPSGGGNPPADMTGGDSSGMVSGQQFDQAQASTGQTSSNSATNASDRSLSALIEAVVALLQQKVS